MLIKRSIRSWIIWSRTSVRWLIFLHPIKVSGLNLIRTKRNQTRKMRRKMKASLKKKRNKKEKKKQLKKERKAKKVKDSSKTMKRERQQMFKTYIVKTQVS